MRVLRTIAVVTGLAAAVLAAEVGVTFSKTFLGSEDSVAQDISPEDPDLTLWILGDSTSAGVGASGIAGTVSAHLSEALVAQGRQVRVVAVGVSGAKAPDLGGQVDRLPSLDGPTVALIQIGANDTIRLASLSSVRTHLADAIQRLQSLGARVVLAPCPDMGAPDPFPQPLRWLAGWRGRRVERVEADVAQHLGAYVVPLAERTGPPMRKDAALLSSDRFHPSDLGYALWASVILPFVEEAARA